jgi:hypothetical protein
MCYYLNHIKLDLLLGRQEFLRTNADHIVAMMSGFITKGKDYKGAWGKFKISCFASKNALNVLCNTWSTRNTCVTMEHVVPINIIGKVLLDQQTLMKQPLTCDEILQVLQNLLIPCLITDVENKLLTNANNGSLCNLKESMPPTWVYMPKGNNQWARYHVTQSTNSTQPSLFSDIVAIAPPTWMKNSGFPNQCHAVVLPDWLTNKDYTYTRDLKSCKCELKIAPT